MKRFGKNKVIGILDCLKIGEDPMSLKITVVYNLAGSIIFRSCATDGQTPDSDCVAESYQDFISPNLKSDEILLTSRHFVGEEFEKLKTAPNANMRKAIEKFYEIRLKKFSLFKFFSSDCLPFYDEMLTICCGLVCLSSPVEFGQEEETD